MIPSHAKTIYEALGRGPVHPFPARMSPGIALDVVGDVDRPLTVLDPMMGSGTVLALARSKGHRAIGVDIDPLAVLISRVWTRAVDTEEVRHAAVQVLRRARRVFARLRVRDAYPRLADRETRGFVRYWFDAYARRQLTSLALAIDEEREGAIRDCLWCAFSRLIISKQAGASLAMDLSHSRPHKRFDRAPVKPFRGFLGSVDRVADNCIGNRAPGRGPAARSYEGDARSLPLRDGSVDLVLTSPPYLNAIDYIRCSKFSLVWMGHGVKELRRVRARSVGAEKGKDLRGDQEVADILAAMNLRPKLATRQEAILTRYLDDTRRSVGEVARVLAPGGRAVYVVGENTIRGTYVRNSVLVTRLAGSSGLKLRERHVRLLPPNRRYLPPPSMRKGKAALDARMRREVVLAFDKPAREAPAGP